MARSFVPRRLLLQLSFQKLFIAYLSVFVCVHLVNFGSHFWRDVQADFFKPFHYLRLRSSGVSVGVKAGKKFSPHACSGEKSKCVFQTRSKFMCLCLLPLCLARCFVFNKACWCCVKLDFSWFLLWAIRDDILFLFEKSTLGKTHKKCILKSHFHF